MRRRWACLSLIAGCGGASGVPAGAPMAPAQALVSFAPDTPVLPLQLDDGTLHLTSLQVVGDVEGSAAFTDLDVSLVSASRAPRSAGLASGLYSRVQMQLDALTLHGRWRDRPLTVSLSLSSMIASVRAQDDADVAEGDTLSVGIGIDDAGWWSQVDLDAAGDPDDGIVLDDTTNTALGDALRRALPGSFHLDALTPQ